MKDSRSFFTVMYVILLIFGVVEWITWVANIGRDDIYYRHIVQAQEVCEDNGGLHKIEGETFTEHEFICSNGAVFTYKMPLKEATSE